MTLANLIALNFCLLGLSILVKLRVEGNGTGWEIHPVHELAGLASTVFAIHLSVLPLNRERAVIMDIVESTDDLSEIDTTVTQAAEIPRTARVAEADVSAEHTCFARMPRHVGILHVNVENLGGKLTDELHVVHVLVDQVAWVKVEPKLGASANRFQGAFGTCDVEGDLGRMDFQGKPDTQLSELVENRIPALGEILVAIVDVLRWHRREAVKGLPDAGSSEAVHHIHAAIPG